MGIRAFSIALIHGQPLVFSPCETCMQSSVEYGYGSGDQGWIHHSILAKCPGICLTLN